MGAQALLWLWEPVQWYSQDLYVEGALEGWSMGGVTLPMRGGGKEMFWCFLALF